MRKTRLHSRAGFTLVELLVGTTLSAAVMAAVLSSYIYLGRSFARLANQQTLEAEARRTLTYFSRDVHAATGLAAISTAPTSPATNRVDLIVPVGSSTNTITYYYNNTAAAVVVSVNGTNITMPANALTRCVYDGTTVTSLLLLRYITDNEVGTFDDLTFRYYDASNNAYTTYVNYLSGIRQVAVEFSTQTGVSANGTRTQVYRVASSRLLIHNSALLQ